MTVKRILIALAHPDDEAFGLGGIIAKYVSEGVEVYYICATDGAAGTVAPEYIEKYGSVAAVRQAEMDCAAQTLGFKAVFMLGYGDSGMMGSPENNNPACLWQADEDEVTAKVVRYIRELRPQIVITFDKFGGYGHPDHIFIHRATTRAFHAAGDPAQYPELGQAFSPSKLYYGVFPRIIVRFFVLMMRLRGQNPRKGGANQDMDFVAILENTANITTRVNIKPWREIWDKASECHASQGNPTKGLPVWLRFLMGNDQHLMRAYPEPRPRARTERDLFENLPIS